MERLIATMLRLPALLAAAAARRDDRGDVPGWVLVTVMTVGIVTGIWAFAQPELVGMVRQALNSVR
jgi:hypothetical protein